MKSSIKEEKGLKRRLEFIVTASEAAPFFSANYQKVQKKAKMPGFRQGKIPLSKLKPIYRDHVCEAVRDDLFRSFYPQALKANQLRPAGPPALIKLELEEGKDCLFLLELEVHPQVKAEQWMNLELKKPDTKVEAKQVDETLEKLRQSFADFKDSSYQGPAKKSDFCVIDLEGFSPGGGSRQLHYPDLLLQLGENRIGPHFDDQIIGLSLNEEKKFSFEFPKTLNHKSAGQKLDVKVKLKLFKDKKVPEINDDLARRFKLNSLAELKSKVKQDLQNNLEQRAKEEMENNVVRQLAAKNPVDLPQSLVQEHKERLKSNAKKRLQEYKMPPAEQEAFLKEKDSEFEKEAIESLHSSYLVEQLIQDLKIQIIEEDIQKSLKESFPSKDPEDMKKELKEKKYWDHFIFNLTRKKVISRLIENAKIIS